MGSTKSPTAGVIGLGEIGRGVAANLQRAGLELVVFDLRAEATAPFSEKARVAADPADLAGTTDVVIVAVFDDAQVLSVLEGQAGVLSTIRAGSTVLVLSTVSPETVRKVAEQAREHGVDVLDCAVSGGPGAAADGSLVAMVGGDEAAIEKVKPVLDGFCSLVVRMGPLGAGLQAKLARNLVQYGSWLAAFEGQLLAEAAGIELGKLAQVIRASDEKIGGASKLMFRKTAAPFGANDDTGLVAVMQAAADVAHKDLRAALDLAEQLGVSLPLAKMTYQRTDALFGVGPDGVTKSQRADGQ